MMLAYEMDGFTQSLGPGREGINYTTWEGTQGRYTYSICRMNRDGAAYMVDIEDDELEETVCEGDGYPTFAEANAFIEGWLAAGAD